VKHRDKSVKDIVLQTNDWIIALVDSPVKHRDKSVKDTVKAGCLASLIYCDQHRAQLVHLSHNNYMSCIQHPLTHEVQSSHCPLLQGR
jgi:hypothetical protein